MNWNMLGHEWAVDLLRSHVAQQSQHHAYLITGLQGLGRRTLAMRFAQALNCPQPLEAGEPCLTCSTCQQIERFQHPDLSLVQAEEVGGTLKVDQVRELLHSLALAPYTARYRVAILLRFEEAHRSAANALLKTLEEPPPQVIWILTAESAEVLPPTIVSRCEVLRLRPLPIQATREGLVRLWGLSSADAELLAHISGGRPGYAQTLHHSPERLKQRTLWLEDHQRLLSADRVKRFAYVDKYSKDRPLFRQILEVWLSLWRDILLQTSRANVPVTNIDQQERINRLVQHVDLTLAHRMVRDLRRTLDMIDHNVNLRLAVEVLLLDLPKL